MANLVYMAKSAWTGLLDSIRAKAGTAASMTVSEATTAVQNIPTGGGGSEEYEQLVMRTISAASGSMSMIGKYAFAHCDMLTTASFPVATTIGSSAFAYCSSLATASFPVVTKVNASAFYACYMLTTASFPAATVIGNYAFRDCYHLTSLYLTGDTMAQLSSVNVFGSTPISNYTASTGGVYGSIFVPASLYDAYISAANWSYYSSRFVSV